mmetsp:Transcript_15986/g.32789  ORF Transcript_15986/g.32789 Transcript_15986/m.32789 type:complete len:275 (-) Transcript_15986:274-1098(-)
MLMLMLSTAVEAILDADLVAESVIDRAKLSESAPKPTVLLATLVKPPSERPGTVFRSFIRSPSSSSLLPSVVLVFSDDISSTFPPFEGCNESSADSSKILLSLAFLVLSFSTSKAPVFIPMLLSLPMLIFSISTGPPPTGLCDRLNGCCIIIHSSGSFPSSLLSAIMQGPPPYQPIHSSQTSLLTILKSPPSSSSSLRSCRGSSRPSTKVVRAWLSTGPGRGPSRRATYLSHPLTQTLDMTKTRQLPFEETLFLVVLSSVRIVWSSLFMSDSVG